MTAPVAGEVMLGVLPGGSRPGLPNLSPGVNQSERGG